MKKTAIAVLILICFACVSGFGEAKFRSQTGTVVVGGSIAFNMLQSLSESGISFLTMHVSPIFGQFFTKDTMLFTFCDFQLTINLQNGYWQGGLDIGAQGRYFLTTEEPINIFLGLELAFGIKLVSDYSALQEHLLTGAIVGLFIPFSEKIGLDFTLSPLFYIPLNTYFPFSMIFSLSAGIISTL